MSVTVIAVTVVSAFVVCVLIRRTGEAKLRRSESRFHELVDSLPHFIYHVDEADRYLGVNAAVAKYFRRRIDAVIGRTAAELGADRELAAAWTAANAQVRSTGTPLSVDLIADSPGELRHIRNSISPTRDHEGRVTGVIGIGIDITEQKVAEAATRRLLSAVEQLDEVIFTTDLEGRITYVNPAFERVYGYTREEAIGHTPRLIKSGELSPAAYRRLWSELMAGRSTRIEYTNRAKDGSLVNVIGTATPVLDGGKIAGFVAVQQDVTARDRAVEERRRLDERLQRLAKLESLGTLAGGIAHDFNNILSIILSQVELVERVTQSDPSVAPAIQTVKQAIHRGAGLSKQILTFARRTDVALEAIDPVPLIRELASMLTETLPRTIRVIAEPDGSLPPVLADASQLHQALLNLCLNARDAMPDGGTLRISAHGVTAQRMATLVEDGPSSDGLCIVVSDDGIGMDADTRQRIFEPFFTTKEKGRGTGLGLAMVYGIVKAHRGCVELESELGAGATFRIYLPVASAVAAGASDDPPPPDSFGGTETLLLIDDETAILDGLEIELTSMGYRVLTACDGLRALEICRSAEPLVDVIVTDLGMPRMSATDLIRALRDALPDVPVLGMTGYVDPVLHDSIYAAGAVRIVRKPFDSQFLLRNVREVLDEKNAATRVSSDPG